MLFSFISLSLLLGRFLGSLDGDNISIFSPVSNTRFGDVVGFRFEFEFAVALNILGDALECIDY